LPKNEQAEGYRIRQSIMDDGLIAFQILNTRQLKGKLWEIKFSANRIMHVVKDDKNVYFLHACKKQKGKAEKFELEKAVRRANIAGLKLTK
jgi:phage-related protein